MTFVDGFNAKSFSVVASTGRVMLMPPDELSRMLGLLGEGKAFRTLLRLVVVELLDWNTLLGWRWPFVDGDEATRLVLLVLVVWKTPSG